MRRSLEDPQKLDDEIGNPFSIAVVSPFPKTSATKQSRLIDGAVNIRRHINMMRDALYARDYADLMTKVLQRQCQFRDAGKRLPASMLLTSWSHTPFADLQIWSDLKHRREATLLQPIIGCIPLIPVPRRNALDPQIGIVWKGKEGDGYWFTASLEEGLWHRILDISL
jgi:hypothetical protein